MSHAESWHPVTATLPDADLVVLVYMPAGVPSVSVGRCDNGQWCSVNGVMVPRATPVTHWAELPAGPE